MTRDLRGLLIRAMCARIPAGLVTGLLVLLFSGGCKPPPPDVSSRFDSIITDLHEKKAAAERFHAEASQWETAKIKAVQDQHNLTLLSAKQYIEAMQRAIKVGSNRTIPPAYVERFHRDFSELEKLAATGTKGVDPNLIGSIVEGAIELVKKAFEYLGSIQSAKRDRMVKELEEAKWIPWDSIKP